MKRRFRAISLGIFAATAACGDATTGESAGGGEHPAEASTSPASSGAETGSGGAGAGASGSGGAEPAGGGGSAPQGGNGGGDPLPACEGANLPPTAVTAVGPANGAVVTGPAVELEVTIDDDDSAAYKGRFYLREVHDLSAADDFTVVIMPDTQNYTQNGGAGNSNMSHYYAQTEWVAANRDKHKIVAVLHNGDIVQHGNIPSYEYEWERAESAMSKLEGKWPKYPHGVPYGLAVGNHDNGASFHDNKPNSTAMFNKYFGVKRFEGRDYYGGHYGQKNDNSWIKVRAGNLEVVAVNFEYRGALGQDPKILGWGRDVFKQFPQALGIVNSHYILRADGTFSAEGKQIYNAMKGVRNVQLMTSGHIKDHRRRRTDKHLGNVIHSILADYQHDSEPGCFGGCGYMRLWHFSPMKNELFVRTYSPSLKKYWSTPAEEFKLNVDLSAAKGVFVRDGVAQTTTKTLKYTVKGLKPGRSYKWYAEVVDCDAVKSTEVASFETQ